MSSLQIASVKIKKTPKEELEEKNFICGACTTGYNSYPALRLHVKRKHDGIMPPNSKIVKIARPPLDVDIKTGRPMKATFFSIYLLNSTQNEAGVDNIDQKEEDLEILENELIAFLAEKVTATNPFVSKLLISNVVSEISKISKEGKDKWFISIQDEAQRFLTRCNNQDSKTVHLNFSEDFVKLNFENALEIIVWVIIWLIQVYLRIEFVHDLCLIFSKIWKVINEAQLSVQDLDNKIVWKKVMKDCEGYVSDLAIVKKDMNNLSFFIQKICQLIGKATEEKDPQNIQLLLT